MAKMGMAGRSMPNAGLVKTRAGVQFSTLENREKIPVLRERSWLLLPPRVLMRASFC